ncbi:MAG: cell division protein ZipA [Halioglobus sp.]|nr:cell division protein ZipA [Halioglobus sp.]
MDLTIRDWMVVVGVLLIVVVLLDAWRRVRRDRRTAVKVRLVDSEGPSDSAEHDFSMFGELPNGGARVVDRGDILRAAGYAGQDNGSEIMAASSQTIDRDELVVGMTSTAIEGDNDNVDWLDGLPSNNDSDSATRHSVPNKLARQQDPEVFMLNVVARSKKGFRGDDILQILLACDLRFGDMAFFHRHEHEAGRGAVQFSVANMMQPGVFDIDNMADMTTPGLVFFLALPGPEDMMQAFDYMLETAKAVSRNLHADVLDESRSVVSKQTIDHSRQKIRDLELRLLAKAH